MIGFKIVAAFLLVFLLVAVGWVLAHLRRIKRELIADEAMPKPGPRANLLILLTVVLIGFSGLLVAFLLH